MDSAVTSSSATPARWSFCTSGLKPRRLQLKMAEPFLVSRRDTPMMSSAWSRWTSHEPRMREELENVGTSQNTRSQRFLVWRCSCTHAMTSACTYSCSGGRDELTKPLRSMLRRAQSKDGRLMSTVVVCLAPPSAA